MPSTARALKWEFFLTRWQQAYEVVSGALGGAAAAAAGAPRLNALEAARLDVLLLKAERARSALARLRELDARHVSLAARYGPLAGSLPELRRRLRADELHRVAEYARAAASAPATGGGGAGVGGGGGQNVSGGEAGGLREPLAAAMRLLEQQDGVPAAVRAAGATPGATTEAAAALASAALAASAAAAPVSEATAAGRADRFGIRVGFRAEHPLGVMRSWAEYCAAFGRVAEAAGELLTAGPPLERLAEFNRERRALLAEASSLRRQLVASGACAPSDEAAAAAANDAEAEAGADGRGPPSSPPLPGPPPDLSSVERDCDESEALAAALRRVRAAHAAMVARGLGDVDLDALGARLALRMRAAAADDGGGRAGGGGGGGGRGGGEPYEGSEAQAAVGRLRALKAAVCGGGGRRAPAPGQRAEGDASWRASALPHEAWEELRADVQTLGAAALRLRLRDEGRRQAAAAAAAAGGEGLGGDGEGPVITVQDASDLNVARAQQALYERLSQLGGR